MPELFCHFLCAPDIEKPTSFPEYFKRIVVFCGNRKNTGGLVQFDVVNMVETLGITMPVGELGRNQ